MGGTSTDVSRYSGKYEHVFESVTAGVAIQVEEFNCCGCFGCVLLHSCMMILAQHLDSHALRMDTCRTLLVVDLQ